MPIVDIGHLVLFLCSTHRLDRVNANGVLEEQYSLYAVFSILNRIFQRLQIVFIRFNRIDEDFHAFRSFGRWLDYLLSAVPPAFGFGVPSTFVIPLYTISFTLSTVLIHFFEIFFNFFDFFSLFKLTM